MKGVSVASAVAAAISRQRGRMTPSCWAPPTTAEIGPTVGEAGRRAVECGRCVDGDRLVGPVFGGTLNVTSRFTDGGPDIWLVRPKSFEPAGGRPARGSVDLPVPDLGSTSGPTASPRSPKAPSSTRLVVSGGRGLGAADAYSMIEGLAKQSPRRGPAGPSWTRAGCPTATRSARPARWSSRRCTSHLGRHPAPGGHEGLQEHHRHQQGLRGPHLRGGSASSATCTRSAQGGTRRPLTL